MGKLTERIAIALCGVILFAGLAHAASYSINGATVDHSLTTAKINGGNGFIEVRLLGETIPTSSSITIDFDGIGGINYFDSKTIAVSAGSITTGNYTQAIKDLSGNILTVSSGTHTQGTELVEFKTGFMRYTIENLQAAPVTVTQNIILSW